VNNAINSEKSALSRSGKNILHVDENVFYGDAEAAFSIDEVDEWATRNSSASPDSLFAQAEVVSKDVDQLASSRSYSIALAPQMIHAGSTLLSQLVASKAYRQIEFLAVGSFYIFQSPNDSSSESPSLSRVPSTREDVFANTAIPARSKRFLMKFLKFVLEYDAKPQTDVWKPRAEELLVDFLGSEFKLDALLQSYVITLTLSLDGNVSVKDGLAAIHRHMTSMGRFGTGFAAVYPKWGGLSEVAQVGCRAAAVGGAIYMLGTGIHSVKTQTESAGVEIALSNDMAVKTKSLVQTQDLQKFGSSKLSLSRLTAVVKFSFSTLFESVVEGAPVPAVAIVGFPPGSVSDPSGDAFKYPVYAMVHSSDTGECPAGQCKFYEPPFSF
jgi:Rab proteins geranylgeranyltransferase component A